MMSGIWLRLWVSCVCLACTMEWLIDFVIADLQCEYDQVSRSGWLSDCWRLLFNGYLVFWKVLAFHVPIVWMGRIIRVLVGSEQVVVGDRGRIWYRVFDCQVGFGGGVVLRQCVDVVDLFFFCCPLCEQYLPEF